MGTKIFLRLLMLWGIFIQEIVTLPKNSSEKSSKLKIRKKRVINGENRNTPVSIQEAPYIVNILANGRNQCTGSFLAPNLAITAAHCFHLLPNTTIYTIRSGSSNSRGGIIHNIRQIIPHPNFRLDGLLNDLALVVFAVHFDLRNLRNRAIKLYNGNLPPNSSGTIISWGCNGYTREGEKIFPDQLQSITVPIINFEECRNVYHNYFHITNQNICTHDPNYLKRCDNGDSGAPLVVNRRLVGVMSWNEKLGVLPQYPDVFMNILNHEYRSWILSHVPQASAD